MANPFSNLTQQLVIIPENETEDKFLEDVDLFDEEDEEDEEEYYDDDDDDDEDDDDDL